MYNAFYKAETLEQFILEKFAIWNSGKQENKTSNIEEFSRKNLTRKLSQIL